MIRLAVLSIAALALAACSQPAQDNVAVENATVLAVNEVVSASNEAAPATPPFAETPGAHPTASEPAPIPAKFRGTWADDAAACADLKHPSRLGISGRTVRYPDFVIFGDSVAASANQFALKGKIEASGAAAEAQYFIDETGDTLTDGGGGGAVRVRCG